jgi:hypothetical protein
MDKKFVFVFFRVWHGFYWKFLVSNVYHI